ncbi:hypothetical protein KKA23_01125 [Patescibacteria group bacterium]|nr:hypothetical protein [Patescibacteria group bacterium]
MKNFKRAMKEFVWGNVDIMIYGIVKTVNDKIINCKNDFLPWTCGENAQRWGVCVSISGKLEDKHEIHVFEGNLKERFRKIEPTVNNGVSLYRTDKVIYLKCSNTNGSYRKFKVSSYRLPSGRIAFDFLEESSNAEKETEKEEPLSQNMDFSFIKKIDKKNGSGNRNEKSNEKQKPEGGRPIQKEKRQKNNAQYTKEARVS